MANYISITGNLAAVPELRTDKNGRAYAFARVIRTDRLRRNESWIDGPVQGYDVPVWGAQAEALCDLAERCGNVRVKVSGIEEVDSYQPEDGSPARVVRRINDAEVTVSLMMQKVTVEKA